mmetsp:Transcript_4779/g.17062  ORF Transcript_4779/g.17062 Transcript_4779/m.17062 type:complete len:286 (-) Transcript_4779:421-1278(-)
MVACYKFTRSPRSRLFKSVERFVEVLHEIPRVLEADGEADERGRDVCVVLVPPLGERLDTPNARRRAEEFERLRQPFRRRLATALDGEDAAGAVRHLPRAELWLLQRRVVHLGDEGVHVQECRHGERRLGLAPHAEVERAQRAQQEPCLERAQDCARGHAVPADGLEQRPVVLARQHDAREHVRVARERLGRRVHDHHHAECGQRRLQRRWRERRVDDDVAFLEQRGRADVGGDVGERRVRVLRRLEPNNVAGLERAWVAERRRVDGLEERGLREVRPMVPSREA